MDDDHRARFEAIGEKRLRTYLASGMIVWHLVLPAFAWLDERDAEKEKEKPTDAAG